MMLFAGGVAFAAGTEDYSALLRELVKVSGREEAYGEAIKQTIAFMKLQHSDADAAVWASLEAEFANEKSFNTLIDMLLPVYQKYFTAEDIKELIKFYKSPVGKKYTANAPKLSADSAAVGYEWGAIINDKLKEKLKAAEAKKAKSSGAK